MPRPHFGNLWTAVTLRVQQDCLNGTVAQSVLLPTSYTISDSHGYLRIKWTRAGTRIVELKCTSKSDSNLTGCSHRASVPDRYKHRAVLFPENASLLLKDLQLNDSGTYELSISHSTGTEKASLMLTVQPDTRHRMDADKKRTPGVEAKVRYVSLIVILIFLCFTVKTRRGCKRTQEQTERENAPQDCLNSPTSNPASLYTEMESSESTGTNGRKMCVTDENTEFAHIQILRN
ncbi:cell surface A33 antigen-like isoform X2 [Heptranchias perlo]|uniref:cell surface A33 antigen-like isoform X2 n=1 Tax=Heptranchias perlo TaxID=212740 RepID=UPI00355A1CA1